MTVTSHRSLAKRLAAIVLAAPLLAACGGGGGGTPSPSASSTPAPTVPPTAPAASIGPSPSGCPTAAPAAMAAGQTATVTFKTNWGDIVIKVEADLGPNAAGNFVALAQCGYFNGIIFHRVAKNPPIIQAGDGQYARMPLSLDNLAKAGAGGPGYTIKDDPVKADYTRGTIAMANTGQADTGGSQFFIVTNDSAKTLGKTYAIFGHVTQGMDVVDRISKIPTGGPPGPGGAEPQTPLQLAVIEQATVSQP